MPDSLRWAPSVNGLCLWHEADKDGEEGYRCVAPMDEAEAGQYAEILNDLGEIDTKLAAWRIAGGWFTPTRECLEDGMLRHIGHYPLEPRPGDVVTSGMKMADFRKRAAEIQPSDTVNEDDRTKIERLKPNAAADSLRKMLDSLAKLCREYDEARSSGRKPIDPNYPPSPPSGHQNLLMSLWMRSNQIAYAKAHIGALLNIKPFLAGDLTLADRDLLTIPDIEDEQEEDEAQEEEHDMPMSISVNGGDWVHFTSADAKTLGEAAKHLSSLEDAIPDECSAKVPMSGKALKVILTAAAAKPGKNDPAAPIHSVGIGKHSICATDQKKAVIVGEVEDSYEATDRTEALVQASSSDLRGEWVDFSDILRLKPEKEGAEPPTFPAIGKVVAQLEGMVEVGTFNPSLLKQVAMVAESLGTSKVTLFRSQGSGVHSMLGFKGEYWPFEQLELFSAIESPVPFIGILAGTEKRHGDDEEKE